MALTDEVKDKLTKRKECVGVSFNAVTLMHFFMISEEQKLINAEESRRFIETHKKLEKVPIDASPLLIERNGSYPRYEMTLSMYLSYQLEQYVLNNSNHIWTGLELEDSCSTVSSTYNISESLKSYLKETVFRETNISMTGLINMAVLLERANENTLLSPTTDSQSKSKQFIRIARPLKRYLGSRTNHNGRRFTEGELLEIFLRNLVLYLDIPNRD
ncbi:hypothetical protein ACFPU1_16745 [Thalassorhabdus alkalitolerans]|uniref:Uncharacterized protein n=1 Tax=Thalassorhabdus alkalitolerans TaxID=2282697 RepID=A0ABW0YRI9_9BACI